MRILPLIDKEFGWVKYRIQKTKADELITKISKYSSKENLIDFIKENSYLNLSMLNRIQLDSMSSCDPGITIQYNNDFSNNGIGVNNITTKELPQGDFILWYEDSFIQFIVMIFGKSWNAAHIVYVKSKRTNQVRRSLVIDSSDIYDKQDKYIKTFDPIKILEGDDSDVWDEITFKNNGGDQLDRAFNHYKEVRPIIKDGLGEDIEDFPDPKDWKEGYYKDKIGLGWFIKYIFNCGRAKIVSID